MQQNVLETLVGAVVIAVAAVFLYYAYDSAEAGGGSSGYRINALVNNVSGLSTGSDVRIAGIKVGTVVAQELDPTTYDAKLTLRIDDGVELPEDTSLSISSEGLLGSNFVSLQPGGNFTELLQDGDEITITQGSLDLMNLVSKYVFGSGASEDAPGTPSN